MAGLADPGIAGAIRRCVLSAIDAADVDAVGRPSAATVVRVRRHARDCRRPVDADRRTMWRTGAGERTDRRRQLVFRARASLCGAQRRSEEHTSELQSLMRNSYAVFC